MSSRNRLTKSNCCMVLPSEASIIFSQCELPHRSSGSRQASVAREVQAWDNIQSLGWARPTRRPIRDHGRAHRSHIICTNERVHSPIRETLLPRVQENQCGRLAVAGRQGLCTSTVSIKVPRSAIACGHESFRGLTPNTRISVCGAELARSPNMAARIFQRISGYARSRPVTHTACRTWVLSEVTGSRGSAIASHNVNSILRKMTRVIILRAILY